MCPLVTKGVPKRRKRKGKEQKRKKGGGQKKEKIGRQINRMRGAPFRGGFKVDAGGVPSPLFCRDRAPVAKKSTKSCKLTIKIFFSLLLRGHIPTDTPVPKVLLVLKFGHPLLFFQILGPPGCHSSASGCFREVNFRGAKLRGVFLNFAPGRQH